jgi:hypothetical protein
MQHFQLHVQHFDVQRLTCLSDLVHVRDQNKTLLAPSLAVVRKGLRSTAVQ